MGLVSSVESLPIVLICPQRSFIKDMDAEAMLFKIAEHLEAAKKIIDRIELPCGKIFDGGLDVQLCIEKANNNLQDLIHELGKKPVIDPATFDEVKHEQ